MSAKLHYEFVQELARLKLMPAPFVELLRINDLSVEIFAPRLTDQQGPHSQDEFYIVSSGSGTFRRGSEKVAFSAGDLLFVPAGVDHQFESFSSDFVTYVIFFGPVREKEG